MQSDVINGNNDVSFILSFVILMENVDFRVLPWSVPDGTV